MKTQDEIDQINNRRKECLKLLSDAKRIMAETECSLGASIIGEAINEIVGGGMDEY